MVPARCSGAIGSDWQGKLSPVLYLAGIALTFWRSWAAQTALLSSDNLERGRTPFLHVSHQNHRAKQLHEKAGYRLRRDIEFWSLGLIRLPASTVSQPVARGQASDAAASFGSVECLGGTTYLALIP